MIENYRAASCRPNFRVVPVMALWVEVTMQAWHYNCSRANIGTIGLVSCRARAGLAGVSRLTIYKQDRPIRAKQNH